ncbi:AMP-binding protein (plasmid) [Rhodococcus sp. ZPP]|uniref:class I adenylate-forming enzyme family protein n=1 Tax=Rhodococcus sp. ZPP TaxID=2749906 RepID=UPI001AD85654|nr:AMP-binding protein [Rhodococcus sp. ZPP]QTJ70335.1 AMP-binding protein [Rhodococcus sp. ZPP]
MSVNTETAAGVVWGEEVVEADYAGHPGRTYARSPGSLVELLATVGPWDGRDFLVQGDVRIGHRDFLRAIPAAAEMLAARGVSRGDRVLLHCYNRPEFALATCAAWWLGAVPVYANRWWSTDEARHAIAVAEPALVLSDATDFFDDGVRVESIEQLAAAWTSNSTFSPVEGVALDDPALILFTSGSSGSPKAVVLSSRSVITNQQNLLVRSRRLPHRLDPAGPQPVALVCTPLFHIGGVSNILTNLLIGGRMVMTVGRFDAGEILALIEAERVQAWGGVPTMAIRLLEHPDFDAHDLSSLRSFPLGGAPLPPALLGRMIAKLPQLERRGLANTWGMTETGGFMTVAGNADLVERPGTVGRPYPVVEIRITDPDERGVGEVIVRAPTVMLGYLGIEDGTVDDAGWLHTGDLGHLDDGYLFLDGRSKDIVIRGGENIACAHIEKTILGHPSVIEAAVFGVPHEDLGEELAAAVTHRVGEAITADELVAHCRKTLGYFEIPTHWQIDDRPLPTLAGEKLNKKAIKAAFVESVLEG